MNGIDTLDELKVAYARHVGEVNEKWKNQLVKNKELDTMKERLLAIEVKVWWMLGAAFGGSAVGTVAAQAFGF